MKILPSATSFSPINQDLVKIFSVKLFSFNVMHQVVPMFLPKGKQFTEITGVRIVQKAGRLSGPWMPQPHYFRLNTSSRSRQLSGLDYATEKTQ